MTKAAIITIGDEILIGQIVDTNAAWLGSVLTDMGIEVVWSISVQDTVEGITKGISLAQEDTDLVILTGGLGPTKDDVTKKAIAQQLNRTLYFDEGMYQNIVAYALKLGFTLTDAHKNQCYLPEGAVLLENIMGTAPGMLFQTGNCYLLSMPGVPYEMKWIMANSFPEKWKEITTQNQSIQHVTVRTVGIGETHVENRIAGIVEKLPPDIKAAYLPSLGEVKVRLTSKSITPKMSILKEYEQEICKVLGRYVYGTGTTTLEEALRDLFVQNKKTLSTAESCTGGYIAHRLTSVPGSSQYYTGSIVAYSYEIKEMSLDVSKHTIETFGAVSEETVREMLTGVLKKMGTDVGIAVSGIAGPGGGTPTKPVGTVWLAWGSMKKQHTEKLQLGKDRIKNIQYTAVAAMNRLRLFLTD